MVSKFFWIDVYKLEALFEQKSTFSTTAKNITSHRYTMDQVHLWIKRKLKHVYFTIYPKYFSVFISFSYDFHKPLLNPWF